VQELEVDSSDEIVQKRLDTNPNEKKKTKISIDSVFDQYKSESVLIQTSLC
jgi:hypothetical protein